MDSSAQQASVIPSEMKAGIALLARPTKYMWIHLMADVGPRFLGDERASDPESSVVVSTVLLVPGVIFFLDVALVVIVLAVVNILTDPPDPSRGTSQPRRPGPGAGPVQERTAINWLETAEWKAVGILLLLLLLSGLWAQSHKD